MLRKVLTVLVIVMIFLTMGENSHGTSGNILISEILPNPLNGSSEYIELFNYSDSPIDLTNWTLSDNTSTDTFIDISVFNDLEGFVLQPNQIALIIDIDLLQEADSEVLGFLENLPQPLSLHIITVDDKSIGNGLGNDHDCLNLEDESSQNIDSFCYENPEKGVSFERNQNGRISKNPCFLYSPGITNPENRDECLSFNTKVAIEHLRINEFMPYPGTTEPHEWIELYNSSKETISLSFFHLRTTHSHYIIKNSLIKPHSFLVIDLTGTSIRLKNSSDEIRLESSERLQIDHVFYKDAIVGQSYSKNELGWTNDYRTTRGSMNQDRNRFPFPSSLFITEIYPSPEKNQFEWIELYNNSNKPMNIQGYFLRNTRSSAEITDNIIIDSFSHRIVNFKNLSLKNAGDRVILLNQSGDLLDSSSYPAIHKKNSAIRIYSGNMYGSIFKETNTVTPNAINVFKPVTLEDVLNSLEQESISQSKIRQFGEYVYIKGTANVDEGILGENIFYIQDDTSGIQVFVSKLIVHQPIFDGDQLKIKGVLRSYHGEKRIFVDHKNGITFEAYGEPPSSIFLSVESISQNQSGKLVTTYAQVSQTNGDRFTIRQNNSEILVQVKDTTSIVTPKKRINDFVSVTGILSFNGSSEIHSLKILPRKQSDLIINEFPIVFENEDIYAGINNEMSSYFLGTFADVIKDYSEDLTNRSESSSSVKQSSSNTSPEAIRSSAINDPPAFCCR